jgi:hypothetical protein
MFWMILFVAGLAGLAYGWIVVRTGAERITISLELGKITTVLGKAKEGVLAVIHSPKGDHEQRGQHSRTHNVS